MPLRSLASTITTSRGYRPRAANGRFIRPPDELPADRFLEREISWLQLNERVLQLAMDEDIPLLERAKFLAIFSSNLDEFFMIRVAGLKRRIATGIAVRSAAGLEPREVLEKISEVAGQLQRIQADLFLGEVRPALAEQGITIVRWPDLSEEEREPLNELFTDHIFPVLTPLSVDPAHPFPYISGLSLNLAVTLVNPKTGNEHFARVKVPPSLPRLVRVGGEHHEGAYAVRFAPLEDVIAANLDQLFTGMEVHEHTTFRVTRNEDVEVEEDDAENLLTAMEKELTRRRFGPPVRLEVEEDIDDHVLDLLSRELQIGGEDIYRLPGPLDLRCLFLVGDLERSDLKYDPFVPLTQPDLSPTESSKPGDIFAVVRSKDVLLHHPYDSFSTSVQAFIEQAAVDPRVLAIKQTLYRTSGDSPIVDALIDAAEAGKQVLAVVEIKARFDEVNNISWARKLEQAGVHVVYGIVGLKTHAKLCLVVRQEAEGLVRYCHIGTGNYNPKTARIYEDLGVLTCDPQVGEDLTRLFNQLSGIAPRSRFKRLLVAPRTVRSGLLEQIEAEVERHEQSGNGPDHLQAQLDRRRTDHRRALPRLPGRGPGRCLGPRHLRAATGCRRAERQHLGPLDAGPVPRALPRVLVRGRRRAGRVPRERRHDAPQPRPPGRGAAARHRAAARRRDHLAAGEGDRGLDLALGAGRGRPVDPPPPRRRGGAAHRPPDRHDRDPPQAPPQGAASVGTTPAAS